MSDWFRHDRNDGQNRTDNDDRYDAEGRDRRNFGGRERWRTRDDEQRSFGSRQVDPGRGGYGGRSSGDYGAQGSAYRDASYRGIQTGEGDRSATYGERGGRDRSYGVQSYGDKPYADQAYNDRAYGGQSMGERNYGDRSYGERSGAERTRSNREAGYDFTPEGTNPALLRIADGESEHLGRSHGGEHRGRGPKNYTRSDARITEDVNDRLSDDSWLDASEIEVKVEAGEVTLSGTVQSREDKRRAEDLAEQVGGVRHVQNSLRIEHQQAWNARGPTAKPGGSAPPTS
jgi:hypothetical protein